LRKLCARAANALEEWENCNYQACHDPLIDELRKAVAR
jgi:hypothetical protein